MTMGTMDRKGRELKRLLDDILAADVSLITKRLLADDDMRTPVAERVFRFRLVMAYCSRHPTALSRALLTDLRRVWGPMAKGPTLKNARPATRDRGQ